MHVSRNVEPYHRGARLLHWCMAGMIVLLMVLAIFRKDINAAFEWRSMGLHKSLGLLIFGLAIVRIGWRLRFVPPALDPSLNATARSLAHLVHGLAYAFMLGLPVLGYLVSSAGPHPLDFFGIPLSKLPIEEDSWLAIGAEQGHVIGGYAMAALIVGHMSAALYHHFILRDSTLRRMIPPRAT